MPDNAIMPVKAAFVVKNKFQIAQFENLASAYPGAVYLLMKRKGLQLEFSERDIDSSVIPIRLADRESVAKAAMEFDVVFFQTVFAGIENITAIPLISVQYGLAKERHNYGEWRSLAELNLMYGRYSVSQVEHFSPSVAVGNVKFAGWDWRQDRANTARARLALGLDASKKTILYMPTYGELGTFDDLVVTLGGLCDRYNVMIKMHHNNEANGSMWVERAKSYGISYLFHGGEDQKLLLSASDLIISDFSGAIFDAIYAEIPVVLYQPEVSGRVGLQKFDLSSLEFRRRDELGIVIDRAEKLSEAVDIALEKSQELVKRAASIRSEVFAFGSNASIENIRAFVEAVVLLRSSSLSPQQLYVRDVVRRLLSAECSLRERARSNRPKPRGRLLVFLYRKLSTLLR